MREHNNDDKVAVVQESCEKELVAATKRGAD